jgi:hypothetical protein
MNTHQIQALLTGAIALLVGWLLIQTLRSGEVTISLNGRGVKRADNAKGYWSWTAILAVLELLVIYSFVTALRGR